MELKKWFIKLENNQFSKLGFGVTALTEQHAIQLLQEKVFNGNPLPALIEMNEIHSLDQLDQGHVIPNMEELISVGIWFPIGYK